MSSLISLSSCGALSSNHCVKANPCSTSRYSTLFSDRLEKNALEYFLPRELPKFDSHGPREFFCHNNTLVSNRCVKTEENVFSRNRIRSKSSSMTFATAAIAAGFKEIVFITSFLQGNAKDP